MTRRRLRPSEDRVALALAVTFGSIAVVALALVTWFFGIYEIAPDVVGDPVDQAAESLRDSGISIDIEDAHGTVTAQHPIAGERWFRHQDFILTYTNESGTHTVGGAEPTG
ncbi:PASTA domain-containing protein [Demequina sp. TTPB684]|uniref:PASTA domain-containing protein n=1 Tax=unclassified Demequina TaxID=2620311 RepID=UPI001CF30EC1|nr:MULTISPECIES: PASTA domain-containing protein [unclassified Demequina]MCB2413959.1 PASTA domain-containing protein [Demequina sp. TTPB684]UPU88688.1 PASTA domain-containing protein [Demequina sp. TMPB413]